MGAGAGCYITRMRRSPTTAGLSCPTRSAVDPDRPDDLRPCRGIMAGVIVGLALWVVFGTVVWVLIQNLP